MLHLHHCHAFLLIAYVVLNLVTGKAKEKKLNLLLYILAIIFIIKECSSLFF